MAVSEVLKLNKKLGETPLECILRFRADNFEYEKVNMTYLGRLDPMAEGLLLVLAGDTRDKKKYLEFDKSYEFEVLWGFETDSYDILGLVTNTGPMPQKIDVKMEKLLQDVSGKKTQIYPPYSSRTVSGKALHSWAREGRIEEVDLPSKQVKIFHIEHVNTQLVSGSDIAKQIELKISLVKGDFRQAETLKRWDEVLPKNSEEKFLISKFKADVSSGTYIRSLAHEMGQKLGTCAIAYSIKRTRVGEYKL